MCDKHDHFGGKSALEHLKDARIHTIDQLRENHAISPSGPISCGIDCAKETATITGLLCVVSLFITGFDFLHLFLFLSGWLVWRVARSIFNAWKRLDKMHRIIEEERHEITHNREQEREELVELYKLKGFKDQLLDDVINVLMADDNRLLQVMLEEELGMELGREEHPLKHGLGSFWGVLVSAAILTLVFFVGGPLYCLGAALIVMGISSGMRARRERARVVHSVVWSCGCFVAAMATPYFIAQAITYFVSNAIGKS